MARKGSSALAVIESPKPRRVVGRAIDTNPIIAAIAQVTPDKLDDIAEEIKATESYLAGLRAMHHVGSVALGLTEPVKTVVVPEVVEPDVPMPEAVSKHIQDAIPRKDTPKATEKPKPAKSASRIVRDILVGNPEMSVADVIVEARRQGCTVGDGSLRTLVYTIRSQVKNAQAKNNAKPTQPKNEKDDEDVGDAAEGLPPKDSPFRAEAELTLRKKVAEYVFKKGLVASGDIIRDCKVSPKIVNDLMNHPWFESHMQKWRLTSAGKNEGLEDF